MNRSEKLNAAVAYTFLIGIGASIVLFTDAKVLGFIFLAFAGITFFYYFVIKPRRK